MSHDQAASSIEARHSTERDELTVPLGFDQAVSRTSAREDASKDGAFDPLSYVTPGIVFPGIR
jgi:hypothetical protein